MSEFDFPMAGMSFTAAISKHILGDVRAKESASDRLKQIAFLSIIFQVQISGNDTTYANLVKIIGLPRSTMAELAPKLIERGLLEERRVLNAIGRGHSNAVFIPAHVIENLLPGLRTV